MLTGRHPNRFACFSWGHSLRPEETTIAEVLAESGYVTGHFGKWHLGSVDARSDVSPGASGFEHWFSSPNFYDNDPLMSERGRVGSTHGPHVALDEYRTHYAQANVRGNLNDATKADRQLFCQASPIHYVTPDDPPSLILHGSRDALVPTAQSRILHAHLREAEVEVELHVIPGAPHSFHLQPAQRDLRPLVLAFLERHL